ncbi:ATP-binding cassette domain-containing protein [bacterium]|nr:ATP-binding cassette domain-containing protein [bacterium]
MPAPDADRPHVVLDRVSMAFDERPVVDGLSCSFPRGRVTVILGGSGSGKTTLLRLVAGLLRPTSGRIEIDGTDVAALPESALAPVRARIGMLFQGGALLDSLSVGDNLALPLRERTRLPEKRIAEIVAARLDSVGLDDRVARLLPGQLSGGMLRRVALARAILLDPEILLCDEPFSGLDPISVKRIELLLSRLNRHHGMTILIVSHHIASTVRLADRVLLLLPGRAVAGSPGELRASPDREISGFFDEDLDESLEPSGVATRLDPLDAEPRADGSTPG